MCDIFATLIMCIYKVSSIAGFPVEYFIWGAGWHWRKCGGYGVLISKNKVIVNDLYSILQAYTWRILGEYLPRFNEYLPIFI